MHTSHFVHLTTLLSVITYHVLYSLSAENALFTLLFNVQKYTSKKNKYKYKKNINPIIQANVHF